MRQGVNMEQKKYIIEVNLSIWQDQIHYGTNALMNVVSEFMFRLS